ncbi:MAG: DNA sulfur modification protein DndB [Verrucomicrobiales bacterium]
MKLEPTINIPVLTGNRGNRRQYVTSLPLKVLSTLVEPIMREKTNPTNLRLHLATVRKISDKWTTSGEISSFNPIVIAVADTCRFISIDPSKKSGFGSLECPLTSILEILDGAQRLGALRNLQIPHSQLDLIEWPVHLITVSTQADLAQAINMMRGEINMLPARAHKTSHDYSNWTRSIIRESPFLEKAVAIGKSSMSLRSRHLWAESAVQKSITMAIKEGIIDLSLHNKTSFISTWNKLVRHIPLLADFQNDKISAQKLRESTTLTQAACAQALILLAAHLTKQSDTFSPQFISKLKKYDWSSSSANQQSKEITSNARSHLERLCNFCGLNLD